MGKCKTAVVHAAPIINTMDCFLQRAAGVLVKETELVSRRLSRSPANQPLFCASNMGLQCSVEGLESIATPPHSTTIDTTIDKQFDCDEPTVGPTLQSRLLVQTKACRVVAQEGQSCGGVGPGAKRKYTTTGA